MHQINKEKGGVDDSITT